VSLQTSGDCGHPPQPWHEHTHQANPILTQGFGLGPARSTYYHDQVQKDLTSHSSSNIQDTLAYASPPSLDIMWYPVNMAKTAVSTTSSSKEEMVLLDTCNRSLNAEPSAASNFAVNTARRAQTQVFLKSDEERAHLVRLCIINFGKFVSGKERFWSKISTLDQNLHPEGAALNVKGYMQRYLVQRKKEMAEALEKTGIAESATVWQQSIDQGLELVRDFEDQSKEEKNKTTKEYVLRKREVFTLQENMTKLFIRKRELLECPSSSGKLDNGEDDLAVRREPISKSCEITQADNLNRRRRLSRKAQ